jgi:phage terminase large subunit
MSGESIAETFMTNGVMVVKADNDRLNGWQRIHEFLAEAADGLPYVQIFENCSNLIKCLPQLIYDDKKVEDVSEEPHDITHAPESFRYGLMSRPRPNEIIIQKQEWLPDALRSEEVIESYW